MSWFQKLQRASFGGVPFGVIGGTLRLGRRNAVHEYPGKDEVWVEDLGRSARRITLIGFLVENGVYGGGGAGSVIQQRERMAAAIESAGASTLVHPTLGQMTVSLLDAQITESRDRGGVFELAFQFIEGGQRKFPAASADTRENVLQTCTAADAAVGQDFAAAVAGPLAGGEAVVSMATSTAGGWTSTISSLASDATNLMNTVGSLPGSFGRFFAGGLRDITGAIPGLGSVAGTVQSLIAAGSVARGLVSSAVSALMGAASSLGIGSTGIFASAAQAVTSALLGATTNPTDSIRVLTNAASFFPAAPVPTSTIGTSMGAMQTACGDLFRRAAVVSVARAAANYQPASYDDAVAVRTQVSALLDAEITTAGDNGQDATYNALRAVRASVVQDMTTRGANLATLTTITSGRPLPSLVLAQRVYRDASRSDELEIESGAVHPAFMPLSFKALAQ